MEEDVMLLYQTTTELLYWTTIVQTDHNNTEYQIKYLSHAPKYNRCRQWNAYLQAPHGDHVKTDWAVNEMEGGREGEKADGVVR